MLYLHLTLTHVKGQIQCQANFELKYLINGDKWSTYYYCRHIRNSLLAFACCIYIWHWPMLKDRWSTYYYCRHIRNSLLAFACCIYIWPWPMLKNKWSTYYYCRHIRNNLLDFECCIYIWHWPILKVKVKVMLILTVNIL